MSRLIRLVGAGIAAIVAAIAIMTGITVWDNSRTTNVGPGHPDLTPRHFVAAGIRTPKVHTPEAAGLKPDSNILGVSIGGKHRAYLVDAFCTPATHIVNDMFDDVPVSVTYCDRTDFARVFTNVSRGAPLDLSMAGWLGTQMSLELGVWHFGHQAESPLLEDVAFERMTWREWLAKHPQTEVYTGASTPTNGQALVAAVRNDA